MSSAAVLVHHPELDDFLFAEIGMERSGMSLTTVSLLGRLGLDPWVEAGRFADMPKAVAAQLLGPMIARLPESLWVAAEAEAIAQRLVKLLPQRQLSAAPHPGVVRAATRQPSIKVLLILAALLGLALLPMASGHGWSWVGVFQSPPATSASTNDAPPVDP